MRLNAEAARRAVIGSAREEIANQAGNRWLSRGEQAGLSKDLQRAAQYARAAAGPGRRVSVDDVVDSYASYVSRTFAAVNTRGAQWLSQKETRAIRDGGLESRVWAARAALLSGTGPLSQAELAAKAADFVKANANETPNHTSPSQGKLFPTVNSGEEGMFAELLVGESAQTLLALGQTVWPDAPWVADFDPQRHGFIFVRTSPYVEAKHYIVRIDRSTGEAVYGRSIETFDMGWRLTEDQFGAIFGHHDNYSMDPGTDYEDIELYETRLAAKIAEGGLRLDIGNTVSDEPWVD